jgi:hypothetical protein
MAESQKNSSEGVKKPSSNTILYVIIGALVVCIIAMSVNCGMFSTKESSDLEDEEEQRADEYIEVDATTLGYEFSQNYDTAVRKYLNKNVKITDGYFYEIEEDLDLSNGEVLGHHILIFNKTDMDSVDTESEVCNGSYSRQIKCYPSNENDLQGYKKGDKITIQGKVTSYETIEGISVESCDVL